MFKKMLPYGVVAGLIVGVPMSWITISMSAHTMMRYGMVIGYLIMLIGLSAVFVAIKRHRDADLGGVIKSVSSRGCFTWCRGTSPAPSHTWTSPAATPRP
jgi:hypothetical protein